MGFNVINSFSCYLLKAKAEYELLGWTNKECSTITFRQELGRIRIKHYVHFTVVSKFEKQFHCKKWNDFLVSLVSICLTINSCSQITNNNSSALVRFEATTPCDEVSRSLLHIPSTDKSTMMRRLLFLLQLLMNWFIDIIFSFSSIMIQLYGREWLLQSHTEQEDINSLPQRCKKPISWMTHCVLLAVHITDMKQIICV